MNRVVAFSLILLATLLIRLPYFFFDSIDWDEGTFILVGQSIVDGHLPYVHLWDLKPPLLFGVFAVIAAVADHSIVGVRAVGTVLVALTGWLVYFQARRWWDWRTAALAAAGCVLLATFTASGQAIMSEHVALPFLVGAVVLMLGSDWPTAARVFCAGALVAAAALVRLNLAVVAIAMAGLLAFDALRIAGAKAPASQHPFRRIGSMLVWFVVGGTAAVTTVFLPFVLTGNFAVAWRSVVVAARTRTDTGSNIGERIAGFGQQLLHADNGEGIFWPGAILAGGALFGALMAWVGVKLAPASEQRGLRYLTVLTAATAAGIALSGEVFAHYLIQLAPFGALLFGALAARLPSRFTLVVSAALALALFLSQPFTMLVEEYRGLISRVQIGVGLHQGRGYEMAEYLEINNPDRQPVLMMTDHIVHWLTRTEPAGRFVTHPSTLSRAQVLAVMGTTPERELEAIFSRSPLFVVIDPGDVPMTDGARRVLDARLAERYTRVHSIDGKDFHKRKTP